MSRSEGLIALCQLPRGQQQCQCQLTNKLHTMPDPTALQSVLWGGMQELCVMQMQGSMHRVQMGRFCDWKKGKGCVGVQSKEGFAQTRVLVSTSSMSVASISSLQSTGLSVAELNVPCLLNAQVRPSLHRDKKSQLSARILTLIISKCVASHLLATHSSACG